MKVIEYFDDILVFDRIIVMTYGNDNCDDNTSLVCYKNHNDGDTSVLTFQNAY